MFSFATPAAAGGIYINLSSWQAFGAPWVGMDHERSGNVLYLWEKWSEVPLSDEEQREKSSRPDKMAIGGEGGFQVILHPMTCPRALALKFCDGQRRALTVADYC